MTVSRGVRIPEKQFAQIYEVWQGLRKDHHVQINQVMTVLLELGLATFLLLSEPMQQALFRKNTAKQEIRLRGSLDRDVNKLASTFHLDDRLAFALPRPAKQLIRQEAEGAHKSMSAIARQRIILQEAS